MTNVFDSSNTGDDGTATTPAQPGLIAPAGDNQIGVDGSGNGGFYTGGNGFTVSDNSQPRGGSGVEQNGSTGSLTADGTLTGGNGGDDTGSGNTAGSGGYGLLINGGNPSGIIITNQSEGAIVGGNGGNDALGFSGDGGAGVLENGAALTNAGSIVGGSGDLGGAGVIAGGASTVTNGDGGGTIQGGDSAAAIDGGATAHVINYGILTGGDGGSLNHHDGGAGVIAATLVNHFGVEVCVIHGGNATGNGHGGAGAIISVSADNAGAISGGNGAGGGLGGAGIVALGASVITNEGDSDPMHSAAIGGGNGAAGVDGGTTASVINRGNIKGGDEGNGVHNGGVGVIAASLVTEDGVSRIIGGNANTDGIGGAGAVISGTVDNGGLIIQGGSGALAGGVGLELTNGTATVTNDGIIQGGNSSGGAAGVGVLLDHGGSVTSYGHIDGGIGAHGIEADAINFGDGTATLILGGNTFSLGGKVEAQAAAGRINSIELGSSPFSSHGTIGNISSQFIGFNQLSIDHGSSWELSGTQVLDAGLQVINNGTLNEISTVQSSATFRDSLNIAGAVTGTGTISATSASLTLAAVGSGQTVELAGSGDHLTLTDVADFKAIISDFDPSDTLTLDNISGISSLDFNPGTGLLTIQAAGGPYTLHFNNPTGGDYFHATSNGVGGYTITEDNVAACYCPGTQIRTDRGDVAVESLRIGDKVITVDGKAEAIKWIGRQTRNPLFAAINDELPICIRQGALGNALPLRDLYLSPDHAMLVQGCLVHAGALVNGRSILRIKQWQGDVQYVHIETEAHELILAEGAAAETFMDDDARHRFDNHAEFAQLYPDAQPMVEMELPRICYARQLPKAISRVLDAVADELVGKVAAVA